MKFTSAALVWILIYQEGEIKAFRQFSGTVNYPDDRTLFSGTKAECEAEIARLGLVDPKTIITVTPRQLLQELLSRGITEAQIDAAIAAIPDETARESARIDFKRATSFDSSNPLVAQLAAVFAITDIRAVFAAAKLR